jgi:hypothetical protein
VIWVLEHLGTVTPKKRDSKNRATIHLTHVIVARGTVYGLTFTHVAPSLVSSWSCKSFTVCFWFNSLHSSLGFQEFTVCFPASTFMGDTVLVILVDFGRFLLYIKLLPVHSIFTCIVRSTLPFYCPAQSKSVQERSLRLFIEASNVDTRNSSWVPRYI